MGQLAQEQSSAEQQLETLLARIFNASDEMDSLAKQTQGQLFASSRHLGALQFSLQCGQLHKDVNAMRQGFCRNALFVTHSSFHQSLQFSFICLVSVPQCSLPAFFFLVWHFSFYLFWLPNHGTCSQGCHFIHSP
jgi:hypothetical protein